MKRVIFFIVFIFLFVGCGYKPTTHYVKEALGYNSKYYVNMNIAVNSAKNAVIIKDAVNTAIINRFGGHLVSNKAEADTIMNVTLSSVSTSAIQYDTDSSSDSYGYANLYRTSVTIKVSYSNKNSSGSFSVSDSYEFAVSGSATVSETKKFQAIKNAASKAFDRVISSIAVRSIHYKYKYFISDKPKKKAKKSTLKNILSKELNSKLSNRLVDEEDADRIIDLANSKITFKVEKYDDIINRKNKLYTVNLSLELNYMEDEEKESVKTTFSYLTSSKTKTLSQKKRSSIIKCSMPILLQKALVKIDKSLKDK